MNFLKIIRRWMCRQGFHLMPLTYIECGCYAYKCKHCGKEESRGRME